MFGHLKDCLREEKRVFEALEHLSKFWRDSFEKKEDSHSQEGIRLMCNFKLKEGSVLGTKLLSRPSQTRSHLPVATIRKSSFCEGSFFLQVQ